MGAVVTILTWGRTRGELMGAVVRNLENWRMKNVEKEKTEQGGREGMAGEN